MEGHRVTQFADVDDSFEYCCCLGMTTNIKFLLHLNEILVVNAIN